MFSHVTVGVSDLERASRFYDALLRPLGLERQAVKSENEPRVAWWGDPKDTLVGFYAYIPFDGRPASAGNGSMVAFLARSPEAVSKAYSAGMAAGGTDEGAPGPRPHYGNGYFGAYLRDPDGNKVHVVHRGDVGDAS